MSEEAPPQEIEEESGEEVVSRIDIDTTVKPEIVSDGANNQPTTELLESTNEPKDRTSPALEPTQVHVFAEKQSIERESSKRSPAQVESPPRSNVQSPKPQETSDQKFQQTKDEEPKNAVDVAIQYEPYFERVESSRNAAESDSAAQTLISRPPKKLKSKKEKKQKQSAPEEKPNWSVQRPSKPERPPTPESIASSSSKKHHSGRRLWGRYRPVSNDERLAYKYAELKSLLTEDFVVNADDLIDRQVEETKQVLQNYVSMRRVLGDTSLDDVHSRGIYSADERLRESRERTSRRRRALFGRRNEESQYNAAATVDLGPLPPHKRSEQHHLLESISFPSPHAKLRVRKSSSDHSPPPANAERERTPKPPSEPKPDEITIDTDGEPERPEHEAKPMHDAEPEPHEPPNHVSSSSATAFTTTARRAPPKPSSAAHEREREREREGGGDAAQETTAEQQFSARVAVPFGLEPPENMRERPRSDNQLGDTNNPLILKWLTYKNKVLRRQQIEDIRLKRREKELERSKKAEDEAHKRVAEEAFKRWLEIKEEERLLASRGRTNRSQLGHQKGANDGEGEAKKDEDEDEDGGKSEGEKDPEEAELEQTAQGRMRGSVRPRGNYFFQRRAPWRVKSAPSFSSNGQRVRMSLVGRHSVLSSRPGTAFTGRASEMAEAAAGQTVAEGELLGEGVSPEGERAIEDQRSRASGSGVGVQVTSSEALRRKRHSYQEWLAKKRAELVERRRREEEAKRAIAPNFDADLTGIVPEVARKRIQERRDQKRRVDTNLRRPQSEADEQQVRPGLGYPSPPPNIHYRSNEPPIPGTRQQLWDQRMAVVAAYTRPITLPSELPSEAGGKPANAPPKQTPAAASEAPKQPLVLEASQPKTPKQTSIDRRVNEISERHENPYTQAKQVFDWIPPPPGSARAETRETFGSRPDGVEPLNLQADESFSSPKWGPSSLSPSAKSPPSVSSAHTAAKNKAVTSPKAESSQPTPERSSQQPQVAASASGLVPHPPVTPPARDARSTPRRSRPTGASTAPIAGAGAGAGAGAETEPASGKPSEALKSRPGDWIDALSEFMGAKKEGEPRADAAAPEAASPAESIITPQEAHSSDIEKRLLELENNSLAALELSLFSPKEHQPWPPAPAREAPDETNELPVTGEGVISSAATSTVAAATNTVPAEVKETVGSSSRGSSPRAAETGSEATVPVSTSPREQPLSSPIEHNESPSSPAAAAALSSPSQQLEPPASPPPAMEAAESGEKGEDEGEAAEVVEDAPEIEAAAASDEEDLGNKSSFM